MRTTLALALALFACAPEADEPRDYTLTGPCPVASVPRGDLCDRGVGYTPRFVTEADCSAEAGRPVGPGQVLSIRAATHPARLRCAPAVYLWTYADIRDGSFVQTL